MQAIRASNALRRSRTNARRKGGDDTPFYEGQGKGKGTRKYAAAVAAERALKHTSKTAADQPFAHPVPRVGRLVEIAMRDSFPVSTVKPVDFLKDAAISTASNVAPVSPTSLTTPKESDALKLASPDSFDTIFDFETVEDNNTSSIDSISQFAAFETSSSNSFRTADDFDDIFDFNAFSSDSFPNLNPISDIPGFEASPSNSLSGTGSLASSEMPQHVSLPSVEVDSEVRELEAQLAALTMTCYAQARDLQFKDFTIAEKDKRIEDLEAEVEELEGMHTLDWVYGGYEEP